MENDSDKSRLSEEYDLLTNKNIVEPKCYIEHPCKQAEFDKLYLYSKPQKAALRKRIIRRRCDVQAGIVSLFPALTWLVHYRWKKDVVHDIVSGFTVAIMHIPQGMAYALLGGVPPVVGIYMAFFPVLLYVVMGTSRHISMGTFAVVCMMTSKAVLRYSTNEVFVMTNNESVLEGNSTPEYLVPGSTTGYEECYTPIQVATAVCFVVGICQIALGVLRLGVLSVLLSDTLVSGFTTGAAVHVLTSQVKNLLGIRVARYNGILKVVYTFVDVFSNIQTANITAIIISAVTILILATYAELIKPRISKKLPMPIPVELLAVIIGTLVSMFANLHADYDIATVGEIPTGLPMPAVPPFVLVPKVFMDGLVIAIVAFSINMSMASIFARKENYSVDANQELLASGFSNILGSFFSCIPFAASLSRSLIQYAVGGKTQLASLVSCGLLLFVLLLIGPFFEPLPNCVLASIVVVALKGMFMQVKDLPAMWRQSPLDGIIWLSTFLSVVLLDIDYGLGLGVALSLACVLIMGQRPKVCLLGLVPSTHIYLDVNCYQAAVAIPGVRIIHIAGGLHFANREHVKQKMYRLIGNIPTLSVNSESKNKTNIVKDLTTTLPSMIEILQPADCNKPNGDSDTTADDHIEVVAVILDMMSVCFVDPSAIKTILFIHNDLKTKGILFCLADCSATVYEKMVHCNFFASFPDSQVFPSVHDAVLFVQESSKS